MQNAPEFTPIAEWAPMGSTWGNSGAPRDEEVTMKAGTDAAAPPGRGGKRGLGRSSKSAPAASARPTERELDLIPGFRDRLIASLDQVGVVPRGRVTYVAALTSRAAQTVSRWFDPKRPGLPDLASCVRLSQGLGRSSDWMLGVPARPAQWAARDSAVSPAEAAWVREVFAALRGDSADCDVQRMSGDDMAPKICDGDLLFIDHGADALAGNGIYALEFDGRRMVRRVETRPGVGLVIRCENPGYAECIVKDSAAAKRAGLRVVGKVRGAVGVVRFWND